MTSRKPEVVPARKTIIRRARLLPKWTSVWLQGTMVWKKDSQLALDDGSGIARVDVHNQEGRDLASCVHTLKLGDYIMVVGDTAGRFKGHRLGIKATTVRDLTGQGPMMETMWNLEVVDAFLLQHELSKGGRQ